MIPRLILLLICGGCLTVNGTEPIPPGEIVTLDDGRAIHLLCKGQGAPTTILDAGLGNWSVQYVQVQESIASFTRVCVFDRAGYGWSDVGPFPRTAEANARDLRETISRSDEQGPFIMAGHSYGGITARLYAQRYTEDVFALLLIDSAHPEQSSRLPAELMAGSAARIPEWWKRAALLGLGLQDPDIQPTPFLAKQQSEWRDWAMRQSRTWATMASEMETFDQAIDSLSERRDAISELPLLVLTAGRSFDWFSQGQNLPMFTEAASIWPVLQKELLHLSNVHAHRVSEDGNHALHYSDPESIVSAVSSLVQLYRGELTTIAELDYRESSED